MDKVSEFFNSIIVVDTETTGVDTSIAEVIEVASGQLVDNEWITSELLLGSLRPIPPEASAVNYISNRMIADLPTFDYKMDEIDDLLCLGVVKSMVAHNANFDRKILAESYLRCNERERYQLFEEERSWICTWRLAKAVLGIDYDRLQYGLSYLRYFLDLDVSDDIQAHRAAVDVVTCGRLLERLLSLAIEKNLVDPTEDILPQLISLCWDPIPITKWTIGKKYAGRLLTDIPNDYYLWAIANIDELDDNNSRFNRDLAKSIEDILIERGVL